MPWARVSYSFRSEPHGKSLRCVALVTPIQKVLEVINAFERDTPNFKYINLAPQLN
jgi:hypothetical protein